MKFKLIGGINVYINGKLVASTHNDVTSSFIMSLVKSLIGSSSSYSGYFGMPNTAVVKMSYKNTPVTSAILSHVSFAEETVAGYEYTRIIYSFSDSSRTKYSFDSLQLWTAITNSLLLHVSDASLNSPLKKNPQDVVQVDWWVEMKTAQPFTYITQYLQQQQATNCNSGCNIPSLAYNMQGNFGAFNMMFTLLALPNILNIARNIKSSLTNSLVQILPLDGQVMPLGITKVACIDLCSCNINAGNVVDYSINNISGYISEAIVGKHVYVAFNFSNPCQSRQYIVPLATLKLGSSNSIDLAVLALPSNGAGNSALFFKIPYGSATLFSLNTHQGQ